MVGRIAQHSAAREALACGKEKPELLNAKEDAVVSGGSCR